MDASQQPQYIQHQPAAGQPLYATPVYLNDASGKVVSSRGWYYTKIVLGSVSLTFCIIILGLGGGIISQFPYYDSAVFAFAFAYSPTLLAGIWQTAEFITLCVRRNRGIHPGAHVALHLLIWLGAATDAGFLTAFTVADSEYDSYSYSSSSSEFSSFLALETGLTAMMYMLMVLHFTLFVRACVECSRRNQGHPTVVMVNTQPGVQPAVYYMPPQQMPMGYMPATAPMPMQAQATPLQQPSTTYSSPLQSSHNSTYGAPNNTFSGYYAPQPQQHQHQPQQPHLPEMQSGELRSPESKAELDSSSSPVAQAVTPVSSHDNNKYRSA